MRTRLSMAAAILCSAVLTAQRPPASPDDPIALLNANVVNVRDGRVMANTTIVLRNGRIESVGSASAPPGVKTIDLRGKYVLPGLIDAHTHASDFAAFRRALESGVTTMRSAGVSHYVDVGSPRSRIRCS